jgi:hypothetical protein
MRIKSILAGGMMTVLSILTATQCSAQLSVTADRQSVGKYQVIEFDIANPDAGYANVWEDVRIQAEFTSPGSAVIKTGGFYHSKDTWKVRFAPWEVGTYQWKIILKDALSEKTASGTFLCTASSEKGFVRQHPTNPFRLVFENGSLYNACGIGSCFQDWGNTGTPFDDFGFDGGDRRIGGEEKNTGAIETYLNAYANQAGFNLYRWSVSNCSFDLFQSIAPSGNRYLVREGLWGDTMCMKLRAHGMRIFMDFFGYKAAYIDQGADVNTMNAVRRYEDYIVARYGAYVDFWEVCNETSPSDQWVQVVADYIKSIDPYKHMVSISWDRAAHASIDIASPHWYEKEAELASDTRMVQKINEQRSYKKPIIFGEQGNSVQNWDTLSGLRARIRSWTSFFNEGHLIFWECTFAKDYFSGAANLYIGPTERQYFGALQNYTKDIEPDVQMDNSTTISSAVTVRSYSLRSSKGIFTYLRNAASVYDATKNVSVHITMPSAGQAQWYYPATGDTSSWIPVNKGAISLTAPDFVTDIALRIRLTSPVSVNQHDVPASHSIKLREHEQNNRALKTFDIRGAAIPKSNSRHILHAASPHAAGIYFKTMERGAIAKRSLQ